MANIDLIGLFCDEIDRRFAFDKSLAARFPRCPAAPGGSTRELITFVKDRPGHDRRYATCADKLARELDFRAETTLADGLCRTVDWYLNNECWWRAIQTGAYRDWMKLQYGAALTGSLHLNKPSPPSDPLRLDAQAMHTLKEVAVEFAYFSSVAGEKNDVEGARASILTSILANAVDGPRVDVVAPKPQQRADAFAAHLVWLSEASLLPGRSYLLKAGAQMVGAMVTELKYRLDINTLKHLAAKELHRNEIAFVNIATVEPINFHVIRRK